jgi:hypothetical protein
MSREGRTNPRASASKTPDPVPHALQLGALFKKERQQFEKKESLRDALHGWQDFALSSTTNGLS